MLPDSFDTLVAMETLYAYQAAAHAIAQLAGSDTSAHVHAGMAIYVLVQFVLRTRRASLLALQLVLAAELANECVNRLQYGSWRLDDTCVDIVATMFWPLVLYAMSRYRRHRWASDQARAARFQAWIQRGRRHRKAYDAAVREAQPKFQPAFP